MIITENIQEKKYNYINELKEKNPSNNYSSNFLIDKLNILIDQKQHDGASSLQTTSNIKKTGLLTGFRSSMTTNTNFFSNEAKHFLNKNSVKKINENSLIIEEMVYKRNIINHFGAKKSAVPHGIINKVAENNAPAKPRDGIVQTPERAISSPAMIQAKMKKLLSGKVELATTTKTYQNLLNKG